MKVTKCGASYGRFPRRLAGRGLTWAALAAMPLTVAIGEATREVFEAKWPEAFTE